MSRRKTNEEYIKEIKEVHGDKYDYSKVKYIDAHTPVCIICPEHGEFWQTPNDHLNGHGCTKCGIKKRTENQTSNNKDFIEKAKKIHGDKYDYSKVEYINSQTKVCIICPEHGEFWQRPATHLSGSGCRICGREKSNNKTRIGLEKFITQAKNMHGDKFDYSKVEYVNMHTPVCIICPEHGEFWQTPKVHLRGHNGCPVCGSTTKQTNESFKLKAKKVHGDKYDYSKVEYINNRTKVCIICPEHGEFWQTPNEHLSGYGCKKCSMSNIEKEFEQFLIDNNIKYEWEKKFPWLKYKLNLRLDFYLPDYNTAIEVQGDQHYYKDKKFKKTEKEWEEYELRDKLKKDLCLEHNIRILYYAKKEFEFFDKLYTNKDELLKVILNETSK